MLWSNLRAGLTFCRAARIRQRLSIDYSHQLERANRALHAAVSILDELGINFLEFNEMTANLERLRFEITTLQNSELNNWKDAPRQLENL